MEYGHIWGALPTFDPARYEQSFEDAVRIAEACRFLLIFDEAEIKLPDEALRRPSVAAFP